ncbi:MAG: sulfite exporter TauE/SafE family protein [Planctomycetota bacterium]
MDRERTVSGGEGVTIGLAALVGFGHTLLGPDHYVPFIVLSKARGWSTGKTAAITALCGAGHVLSSVALGGIGIAVGAAVFKLEGAESARGEIAAWLLFSFGLAYTVWGVHRAIRNRAHTHVHPHGGTDSHGHEHEHSHDGEHAHVHASESAGVTPWILFLVFVFGPCEPLIPVLMYPAATTGSWTQVASVALVFSAATIGTMLCVAMAGRVGMSWVPLKKLARYSHALAGAAILACGAAVLVLDL